MCVNYFLVHVFQNGFFEKSKWYIKCFFIGQVSTSQGSKYLNCGQNVNFRIERKNNSSELLSGFSVLYLKNLIFSFLALPLRLCRKF